ncbi:hypothetical protein F5Y00DRAFT_125591 [Daldinia vernicosa]|uniref:uncharacterized protein n=1 Tax=Daldinia vernicosa TaxID=114800 RepID=UPI002008BA71|nr:uncharacterized protein F5Y00DRAFT_125591 [Daldinia vernicosa]KAI0847085.1 hypothetical protein F5Y00DRAFT_125591 [Daldinia vernicosa]
MAIKDRSEYVQPSTMTIDLVTQNKTRRPLPTFQPKSQQNLQRRSRGRGPKPCAEIPVSANRFSKRTLRQYLSTIAVPLPLSKGACHLEILPQDIIDQISQYIPYENLIYLSWVSKALNKMVNPRLAPHETKLSFVLRAERDFYRHYSSTPSSLGCFICYKVLPASVFAIDQPLQAEVRSSALGGTTTTTVVNLRRFCIGCGIQSGLHKPGDELITRIDSRFWICDCLYTHGERTLVCRGCGVMCYLMPRRTKPVSLLKPTVGYWN